MSRTAQPPLSVLVDAIYYGTNRAVSDALATQGFDGIRAVHGKVFENLAPDITVSALAERAQISKQSMADLVAYLERQGYLERAPHPEDRRAQVVRATQRGHAAVAAARTILASLETRWRRRVGAERVDVARAVLAEIAASMEPER